MPFNLLSTDGEIQLSLTLIFGKTSGYIDGMVLQDWNPFVAPTFNDRSTPFLWDWGASGGFDSFGSRKLKWTVFVTGTSMANLMGKVHEIAYNMSPANEEKELCFQIGSEGYTYYGRPRGMEVVRIDTAHYYAWCECRWEALDPRYYSNTTVTVTDTGNNWSIPRTLAHQSTLETAAAPSPWQAVITPVGGSVINPTVTCPVQIFNATPEVQFAQTLALGKEIVLNSRKRTCIWRNSNDTDPVYVDYWMNYTTVWFDLPAWQDPATILMSLRKTGGTSTSIDTVVTYRKCYI